MQGNADADKERRVRFAGECRDNLIAPILAEDMVEVRCVKVSAQCPCTCFLFYEGIQWELIHSNNSFY